MDIIADFLDRIHSERTETAKHGAVGRGTRAPFPIPAGGSAPSMPVPGGSRSPVPGSGTRFPVPGTITGSKPPFPVPGGSRPPMPT